MSRAACARVLAFLLSLPAAGSALVVLTVPPVSLVLPAALVQALRPGAAFVFDLLARLPPESLPGRVFYGSYAPLPALFGSAALATHAALLALPWTMASAWLLWRTVPAKRRPF